MQCSRCHASNREDRRFCASCAAELPLACAACGFLNDAEARFCGGCAARLNRAAAGIAAPPGHAAANPMPSGERRHLTVMFCDLVESTTLATQLDPEDFSGLIRVYHATCADVIRRHEGYVAQYLGDGVLAYFGYPRAHEDDAYRAVRAAMEIVGAVQGLDVSMRAGARPRIAARLGVHTGPVVVDAVGGGVRPEPLAMGETPNIAARVQGLAEPNTVVITAATHRLVHRGFVCRDLGPHTLRGVPGQPRVHQVLAEAEAESREGEPAATASPRFVAREQELHLLLERWQQATEGIGQVVLLGGEAGIGKSRLVQALRQEIGRVPHLRLDGQCSLRHRDSAFYPVIQLLRRVLRLEHCDSDEARWRRLESALAASTMGLAETVPLYAALLSIPIPMGYTTRALSPQRQKQRTIEVVVHELLQLAAAQPVLLVLEDLQWVDPSTLEVLELLVDQTPKARMLVLCTFRPEFRPAWSSPPHVMPIVLNRFTRRQAQILVLHLTGGKPLPDEVLAQIILKTDGIPLFIEELTKMVLESGLLVDGGDRYVLDGPLPPLAIPATLQESLMARLDRLEAVREVAQLAAILGREFSYDLLHAASPLPEPELQGALARLVEAELVYQIGAPPEATYAFKHALVQDAAYQTLLRSTRQLYHREIAAILEQQFPELAKAQPEVLAHHYTEAGLGAQAVIHWHRAARRAIGHSGNVEAVRHLMKGLELLQTVPVSQERIERELLLQTTLGPTLMAIKGYAAPDVGRTYDRARALCQEVGEKPQLLLRTLAGLCAFYMIRGQFEAVHELSDEILRQAKQVDSPRSFLLEAHFASGQTFFFQGDFRAAFARLEQGAAFYDPQRARSGAFAIQDTRVICLSATAWALGFLGELDVALQRSREAVSLATQLSHPFSVATALFYAAWLHQFRREVRPARDTAEAAIRLSKEHGFPIWAAGATVIRGWTLASEGRITGDHRTCEEGVETIRRGLDAWVATGAEIARPYFLGLLAEACGAAGRPGEGLTLLAEALALVAKTGERFYEAELHRLAGTLALQGGPPASSLLQEQGESSLLRALTVAREQGAKLLELRTVVSLARFRDQQGGGSDARRMVAEALAEFSEGDATPDLTEASEFLDTLR